MRAELSRAIDAGVVGPLDRRRSGYDRIARAIMAAAMVPAPRAGHATASAAGR
jgi:hypothetical protein